MIDWVWQRILWALGVELIMISHEEGIEGYDIGGIVGTVSDRACAA